MGFDRMYVNRTRMSGRRPAIVLFCALATGLAACNDAAGSVPEPITDAATSPPDGGSSDAASSTSSDGGSSAPNEPGELDPTDPGPETGVYVPLPPAFEAELQALIDFERAPLPAACPGLAIASSCGNGTCEGAEEEVSCPADCVFHLVGAYNDLPICPAYQTREVARSVDEVRAALRRALQAGQRVRAVGARHSASASICGDGMVIEMSEFARLERARVEDDIVYVEPGVTLFDLGTYLAARGLGIGFTHLGFRRVTVAGAIGTAAHGSSPRHNNSLSHRVASLTMVLADGSVRTFRERDTEHDLWRALTTHLGLLGIVVEVGLYVEKAFALDTEITLMDEAELLSDAGPLSLLEGCDWGQFNWFPHQRKAFRWCGKVTDARPEDVDNTLLDPGVSPDLAPIAKTSFHAGTCDATLNQLLEKVRFDGFSSSPPLVRRTPDGARVHTTRAVGLAHRVTSADLIDLDRDKYFQMDWEVAIPQQYMADALRAARRVFDAHGVSLPGVGVFVRFGKIERGSWLSYHSAGKHFAEGQTAMFYETPVAVPAGYSEAQLRDYLNIYQGMIALFVRHLGARAHWGKNLDAIFELQRTHGTYAGRLTKMNEAVAALDPYGVFANQFGRRIGIVWPKEDEGFAALLGLDAEPCGVEAEPLCDYQARQTYANACRAQLAGVDDAQTLPGTCEALSWAPCGLLDPRTCVWETKALEKSSLAAPRTSY